MDKNNPQTTQQNSAMVALLAHSSPAFVSIIPGEIISGRVLSKDRGKLLVDIGGVATGIVSGKELNDTFNTAKGLQVGDEVAAFVLEDETPEGMVILSLRKAAQAKSWEYFEKIKNEGGTLEVTALMANKGGLMVTTGGVTAFLPVSQLAPKNYPRVDGANAEEILSKLGKLIGKKFTTKIILLDQEIKKLVVSERAASGETRDAELSKLKVGDKVHGEVNGIVKFGIFVTFGNLEGLVHISELTWSHVKNPTELFKIGDAIEAQVIGIEGEKISLSIKRLFPDPWVDKVANFTIGTVYPGTINKVTNFGVFVTLVDDVNGLVHTSEFTQEGINPEEKFKEGEAVTVKVLEILRDDHSLRLSFKGISGEEKGAKTKKAVKKEAPEAAEETPVAAVEEKKPAAKKETSAAKKKPAIKKPAKKAK